MKNGFKVIDGDGHMLEPLDIWEKYTEPAFKDRAPKVIGHVNRMLVKYGPCESFPEGNAQPRPESVYSDLEDRYGEAYRSWWSLPSRIVHMDQEGVDIQVNFRTAGGAAISPNITDSKLQAALCRAYNNWATEFSQESSGRVQFVAQVTMLDVNDSVEEIQRIGNRPEVTAINIPDPGSARQWADDEFAPLWQHLQEKNLAACFHGGGSQRQVFGKMKGSLSAVSHAMSFPLDAMVSMGTMIFGSVLENNPDLRCAFFEANAGWLPFWLARLDDHAIGRQGRFMYGHSLPLKPSEYFARQCFVACDADEGTLSFVADYMQGENLIFNTDYPHADALFPGAVDMFLERDLSDESRKKILWDNSIALYGERVSAGN